MWLPLVRPLVGTWPTTQACAMTGNLIDDPLVRRPTLNQLNYTSHGETTPALMIRIIIILHFSRSPTCALLGLIQGICRPMVLSRTFREGYVSLPFLVSRGCLHSLALGPSIFKASNIASLSYCPYIRKFSTENY